MKVYTVNKKIKKYLARKSHTFTEEWVANKKKRWILCYGGAIVPFVVTLILAVYFYVVEKDPSYMAILEGLSLGLILGIITWPIATINYKIMLFNCGYVDNDGYTDELILDEEKITCVYPPDSRSISQKKIIYFSDIKEIYYQEKSYTLYIHCDFLLEHYQGMRMLGRSLLENKTTKVAMYYNDHEEAVEYIMNHVSCKGERR